MAIREEEYAILAFAMESIVSELLIRHPSLSPPRVYLIDGVPKLGAGREDLVFWWHQSVEKFTHLKNDTRIDLLKVSEEKEGFERRKFRELGLEIGGLDHNNLPKTEKWEFSLSRGAWIVPVARRWFMSGRKRNATRSVRRASSWWWDGERRGRSTFSSAS